MPHIPVLHISITIYSSACAVEIQNIYNIIVISILTFLLMIFSQVNTSNISKDKGKKTSYSHTVSHPTFSSFDIWSNIFWPGIDALAVEYIVALQPHSLYDYLWSMSSWSLSVWVSVTDSWIFIFFFFLLKLNFLSFLLTLIARFYLSCIRHLKLIVCPNCCYLILLLDILQ